jgi:hypothetical protein
MLYTRDEIEATKLDTLIDEIIEQLSEHDASTDDYAKMVDQLSKLYRLKQIETELKLKTCDQEQKAYEFNSNFTMKENELGDKRLLMNVEIESKQDEIVRRKRVSPDTLALIAANLSGIIVIIGYERVNVIASKALGFVSRLK